MNSTLFKYRTPGDWESVGAAMIPVTHISPQWKMGRKQGYCPGASQDFITIAFKITNPYIELNEFQITVEVLESDPLYNQINALVKAENYFKLLDVVADAVGIGAQNLQELVDMLMRISRTARSEGERENQRKMREAMGL